MAGMRLPLATVLETRDSSMTKDGITKNVLFENNSAGEMQLIKRPGLSAKTSVLGLGNGIYFHNGTTWVFTTQRTALIYSLVIMGNLAVTTGLNTLGHWANITNTGVLNVVALGSTGYQPIGAGSTYFYACLDFSGSHTMYRSTDGITWSNPIAVSFNPSKTVTSSVHTMSVPSGNYAYTLNSGTTWSTAFASLGQSLAANSTNFTTGLWYTPVGAISWTACTGVTGQHKFITWIGTKFRAFNPTQTNIVESTDGINWTTGAAIVSYPSGFTAVNMVYNGTIYLIWDSSFFIYTSTDMINWTSRGQIAVVNFVNPIYSNIAVMANGSFITAATDTASSTAGFYTSPDGITWTAAPVSAGELTVTQVVG